MGAVVVVHKEEITVNGTPKKSHTGSRISCRYIWAVRELENPVWKWKFCTVQYRNEYFNLLRVLPRSHEVTMPRSHVRHWWWSQGKRCARSSISAYYAVLMKRYSASGILENDKLTNCKFRDPVNLWYFCNPNLHWKMLCSMSHFCGIVMKKGLEGGNYGSYGSFFAIFFMPFWVLSGQKVFFFQFLSRGKSHLS